MVLIAIGSVFFACQKDNSNQSADTTDTTVKKVNPFQFVGQLHNGALANSAKIRQTTGELTKRQTFQAGLDYCASKGYDASGLKYEMFEQYFIEKDGHVVKSVFDAFKKARIGDGRNTATVRSTTGLDIAEAFLEDAQANFDDYDEAMTGINTFEQTVMTGNMSQSDKDICLIGAATLRSSLQYWKDNYDD